MALMTRRTFFITGTDTGVGKTILTALLARHLRAKGTAAAAFKPVCTGGRDDARMLQAALGGSLTLDEINPWHFRAALAPLLAARKEGKPLHLAEVVAHAKTLSRRCETLLIEGAGGLLSPLGEGFDARDLLVALRATPIIVCPNRLGAVNQARLAIAALPSAVARRAPVVLVSTAFPDSASRTNLQLLAEFFDNKRLHSLPRLKNVHRLDTAINAPTVRKLLETLLAGDGN